MKSMVPVNIVSGFKKCDVYPFNPDAIAIHTPNVASENGATGEPTSGDSDEVLSGMELDKDDSERESVLDFTYMRKKAGLKRGTKVMTSHIVFIHLTMMPLQLSMLLHMYLSLTLINQSVITSQALHSHSPCKLPQVPNLSIFPQCLAAVSLPPW